MQPRLIFLLVPLALAACATQPRIVRTPDGRPDLNGIWQAVGSAHWNIEPHNAQAGPIAQLGALGAIPGGLGVVEHGRIPYTAEAAAKRAESVAILSPSAVRTSGSTRSHVSRTADRRTTVRGGSRAAAAPISLLPISRQINDFPR